MDVRACIPNEDEQIDIEHPFAEATFNIETGQWEF